MVRNVLPAIIPSLRQAMVVDPNSHLHLFHLQRRRILRRKSIKELANFLSSFITEMTFSINRKDGQSKN